MLPPQQVVRKYRLPAWALYVVLVCLLLSYVVFQLFHKVFVPIERIDTISKSSFGFGNLPDIQFDPMMAFWTDRDQNFPVTGAPPFPSFKWVQAGYAVSKGSGGPDEAVFLNESTAPLHIGADAGSNVLTFGTSILKSVMKAGMKNRQEVTVFGVASVDSKVVVVNTHPDPDVPDSYQRYVQAKSLCRDELNTGWLEACPEAVPEDVFRVEFSEVTSMMCMPDMPVNFQGSSELPIVALKKSHVVKPTSLFSVEGCKHTRVVSAAQGLTRQCVACFSNSIEHQGYRYLSSGIERTLYTDGEADSTDECICGCPSCDHKCYIAVLKITVNDETVRQTIAPVFYQRVVSVLSGAGGLFPYIALVFALCFVRQTYMDPSERPETALTVRFIDKVASEREADMVELSEDSDTSSLK